MQEQKGVISNSWLCDVSDWKPIGHREDSIK